jgi:hypothetical protein
VRLGPNPTHITISAINRLLTGRDCSGFSLFFTPYLERFVSKGCANGQLAGLISALPRYRSAQWSVFQPQFVVQSIIAVINQMVTNILISIADFNGLTEPNAGKRSSNRCHNFHLAPASRHTLGFLKCGQSYNSLMAHPRPDPDGPMTITLTSRSAPNITSGCPTYYVDIHDPCEAELFRPTGIRRLSDCESS